MGAVLIRGAYSSNIKERRDCSAALFDAEGKMVAQAEHIPVHLGAMPEAVAAVMERNAEPADVYALNDPYSGGTHLPDITLVSPVEDEGEIIGYAVTRAHHSDVGGMSPGSMPSNSREIYQEGIIIPPVRLVHKGEYVEEILDLILANVRTPDLRRGDLRAQIAGNNLAQTRVSELIKRRGRDTVLTAFEEVIAYTERRTREAIRELPDGEYNAESEIEGDGATDEDIPIKVSVTIEDDEITIDFTGTSDAVAGNVNCPARRYPLGLLLRPARSATGRRAGQRRDLRPAHHSRPRRQPGKRRESLGGRGGQRRDQPARLGHHPARLLRGGGHRRGRPGHDEQPHNRRFRGRRLDLLRDHRRRPGSR